MAFALPAARRRTRPESLLRLLAAGIVACCALGAPPPAAAASPALTHTASAAPFALSFAAGGNRLTNQVGGFRGPGGRMSYELATGVRHTLGNLVETRRGVGETTYVVDTDEPGRRATVLVKQTNRGLRVELRFEPEAGIVRVYEALSLYDEHFLGSGERRTVDLLHKAVQLKVAHGCRNYALTPFYVSSRGYGLWVDTVRTGTFAFALEAPFEQFECAHWGINTCPAATAGDRVQLCFHDDHLSYELYAGTPAQVLDAYTRATGRPALPPPAQFGLVKWRDENTTFDEVREDVLRFEGAGIPLRAMLVDNPWEASGCQGSLRFGAELGNAPELMTWLRQRGIDIWTWISPLVRYGCAVGYDEARLLRHGPRQGIVDFTRPADVALFKSKLRELIALGVRGVKVDRGDDVDIEGQQVAGGDPIGEHNRYPLRLARAVTEVLREELGSDYATIFRSSYAGGQALQHGIWAGDQKQTWSGLLDAARMAQSAGVSGFPIWGSDIGGYENEAGDPDLSAELFVRWSQLGAVSPVMEVGGAGRNATPWEFGPSTMELLRRSATLHYELFPYLYQLARSAARTGAPILRPLGYAFPRESEAWYHDSELLVGPSLLATIVTTPTGATLAERRPVDVWLPQGSWIDLFTGNVAQAGDVARPTGLGDFPLYLRQGNAIAYNFRAPNVWSSPWGIDDLDRADRIGFLYAPLAGRSATTRAGTTTLTARAGSDAVSILVSRPRRETAIRLVGSSAFCGADLAGKPLPRSANAARLSSRAVGWSSRAGETLVKLDDAASRQQLRLTACTG
jgi:alpha-D-xyloside xylohydrolase